MRMSHNGGESNRHRNSMIIIDNEYKNIQFIILLMGMEIINSNTYFHDR